MHQHPSVNGSPASLQDDEIGAAARLGLYAPDREHDSCGVGFVAHIKGKKAHSIVTQGLKILENLDHRGAVGADKLMGDGAGILIQIPDEYYRAEMAAQGVELPPPGEYGVGMIFLPKERASRLACVQELERAVKAEGQVLLGWRDVPVDAEMPMSPTVRLKEPVLRQIFIGRGLDVIVPDALERKLYVIRKTASSAIQQLQLTHSREYYVPSMSCRTVIYKGLLLADQVGKYYKDLQDPRVTSALAVSNFDCNSVARASSAAMVLRASARSAARCVSVCLAVASSCWSLVSAMTLASIACFSSRTWVSRTCLISLSRC